MILLGAAKRPGLSTQAQQEIASAQTAVEADALLLKFGRVGRPSRKLRISSHRRTRVFSHRSRDRCRLKLDDPVRTVESLKDFKKLPNEK